VLTLLLLLVVACDTSSAEKRTTACHELAKLDASINAFQNLGSTATVNQVKDAANKVKDQAQTARKAVREYNKSKAQDLENAVDNFNKAVNKISNGDTIAQVQASVQGELTAVRSAWDNLRTKLNCQA
jgi:hypothetical protein